MTIDIALRKFQSSFRLPVSTGEINMFISFSLKGEAQKIEQLMKVNEKCLIYFIKNT